MLLDQTVRYAASLGHDVTVICGRQGYVAGASGEPPTARIARVPSFPFSRNPLIRLLSWGSFLVLAAGRRLLAGRSDIVVTMTTPPGLSIAAALLKPLLGAKLWIWEMDVYPDVVVATGGLSPGSWVTRLLQRMFTWSRRRADGIIALGECMKSRLAASGIPANRIHIAQNWAEDHPHAESIRPLLRILYSGNLGMAHEVDTIEALLQNLAGESRIQFLFAGGGAARPSLEQRTANLPNVTFQAYGDSRTFEENLRSCHLGLVTLRAGCEGTVVPSKVYSLMSAGRPILFIGPANATPALLIREHHCGWHFDPGQVSEISRFLLSMLNHPRKAAEAGAASRGAFEQHFNRARGTERVMAILASGPC